MIFEGQHVMTLTWYPRIPYKLVNIYTCMRPLIVPNGRVYRYLLAVDPVLLRGNTTWYPPNIRHTCSLCILFFDGRYRIKSTWYHCRLYIMVNLYTCRLPLIIPMPHIPIPARCGPSPFEGQYHYKLAWYQCRSYKQVNLYKYRRPLIIPMPNAMYTHTCSLWNQSFREAILYKVDPISVRII